MKGSIGLLLVGAVVGVSAIGENLMLGGQSALLGGQYGSSTFFNPGQSALIMPASGTATWNLQQPLMNTWSGSSANWNLGANVANIAYQQPLMQSTSYLQQAPLLSTSSYLQQAPVLSSATWLNQAPITGAVANPLPAYGYGAPMAQVNVAPLHSISTAAVTSSGTKSAAVLTAAAQAPEKIQPTANAASAPIPAAQASAFMQPATRVVPPVTPTGYVAIPLYSTGQPTEEDQRNQGQRDVSNRQQGTQSPNAAAATGGAAETGATGAETAE